MSDSDFFLSEEDSDNDSSGSLLSFEEFYESIKSAPGTVIVGSTPKTDLKTLNIRNKEDDNTTDTVPVDHTDCDILDKLCCDSSEYCAEQNADELIINCLANCNTLDEEKLAEVADVFLNCSGSEKPTEEDEIITVSDNAIITGSKEGENDRENLTNSNNEEAGTDIEDTLVDDNAAHRRQKASSSRRESAKLNRMMGEEYVGFRRQNKGKTDKILQDVVREARKMGPPCLSNSCKKFKTRNCSAMSEELRKQLFFAFWKKMDWESKKTYVTSVVERKPTKFKTMKDCDSRRKNSFCYHLKVKNHKFSVCKSMFLSTLGLKENEVRYWLENDFSTFSPDQLNGDQNLTAELNLAEENPSEELLLGHYHGQSRRARNHKKEFLLNFFNSLPKLPAHYCRKDSGKEYLQSDIRSVAHLYDTYKEKCNESKETPLSRPQFDLTYKSLNIGILTPRKDKCDKCYAYESKNLPEEEFKIHVARKEAARLEKQMDKDAAISGQCHTLCCDVMAVQPLPLIRASSSYYKLKLAIHNYTVYNLATHDALTYWFDETESDLSASTFASCLVNYIDELLAVDLKPVIVWSDGCTSQNRNAVLANALLHLSISRQVKIFQKFLERGHTQMEADSVHSLIERSYKNIDVLLPSQYISFSQQARKQPFPYRAKLLQSDFFQNFSKQESMFYRVIRPGRKSGDPVVTDLKVIYYNPIGVIQYKLNFKDSDYSDLPGRPKNITPMTTFPRLHEKRNAIPYDKWKDLQSLKSLIPKDCHGFYDDLPHDENSKRKKRPSTEETNRNAKLTKM